MADVSITNTGISDANVKTEVNINVSSNHLIRFVDLPSLDTTVYGREIEATILADFFINHQRHCAVIAPSCFGKTFLIRKFLQNVSIDDAVFKDSFDKIIYFNCREITAISSVIDKFKVCLSRELSEATFFSVIQQEKILCIFDNFESWIDSGEFNAFLYDIFSEQQNNLRTIFVSQKMPNDENFLAEELHSIGEKLFQGLDKDAALSFAKTEGKSVDLDKVSEEKLIKFFDEVNHIPQAIRSLIGYLKTKHKTFDEFIKDEFTKFESSKERFAGHNALFRPTLYLVTLQIDALDERSRDLLSVLAFFESEVPELVIEKFKPEVSAIEKEVIHSLVDNWLVEEITISRSKLFRYYSPHLMIRRIIRQTQPKFEDKHHEILESLANELFDVAYSNHVGKHNYEEAINLYRCVEKLREHLVNIKGRIEFSNDLAMTYINKGISLRKSGKLNEAINEYDKAIAIREELVKNGQTEIANSLATTYMNKGVSLRNLGKLNESIIEYDKAILILKELVAKGRIEHSDALAKVYMNKGVSLYSLGKL